MSNKHYVSVEEFEEYKRTVNKKILNLEKELTMLKNFKRSPQLTPIQRIESKGMHPEIFFNELLNYLYKNDAIKFINGWFYDEQSSVIAYYHDDLSLRVTTHLINRMWQKICHPQLRVERGFYRRAIKNNVLKRIGYTETPHRTTAILPNGRVGNFVVITDDFLEKFKEKGNE